MKLFSCANCQNLVGFEASRCTHCGVALGYVPAALDIEVLTPAGDASYAVASVDAPQWRCLNAAWGCNWVLDAGTDDIWCRSCRLTRGRPDESDLDAVAAWSAAESAKRRLIHQLDSIGLPIESRSGEAPRGLAFDLVHLPGAPGVTGHLEGIVTLDLTETDEAHREELRRRLAEPFRTVIGHLRHEIGHYYWDRLVVQSDRITEFREVFGDERADYAAALEAHHAADTSTWDTHRYVTAYAGAHPFEDWAEAFAHYLHIRDASHTADAHAMSVGDGSGASDSTDIIALIDRWRPLTAAINAFAGSLGAPAVYPFELTGAVIDKLSFVHSRVSAHTTISKFEPR